MCLEKIYQHICTELDLHIIPSIYHCTLKVPNFLMEVKIPDRNGAIAKQEVFYDGAGDIRAIYILPLFKIKDLKTLYNNNMYIIILAYHSTTSIIQLFITLLILLEKSSKHYMKQIKSFAKNDNVEVFWQRASILRNTKNWAKKTRHKLIIAINNSKLAAIEKINIFDILAKKLALSSNKGLNNFHRLHKQK